MKIIQLQQRFLGTKTYSTSEIVTIVALTKITGQKVSDFIVHDGFKYCHNPNDSTTQDNLNTVGGLDKKMTLYTTPPLTTEAQQKPPGASY